MNKEREMTKTGAASRTVGLNGGALSRRSSEILLAALIIARSTSYMFSKILLQSMGQFTLLGVRSSIAFIVLALVCFRTLRKTRKEDVICGGLIGAAFFIVMFFELAALKNTTSVAVSFEENSAVVLVPIFTAILTRKLPSKKTLLIFLMAGTGIVLLSFKPEGFRFNRGDVFGIMAAVTYAMTIILISYLSDKADPIRAGVYQVGSMGLLSMIAAFITESPALPATGPEWGCMLYLAIVCSVFGFTLQPFAQKGTTAERAGMMCALNPVTAAVLGTVCLGEELSIKGIIGAALIVAGILI